MRRAALLAALLTAALPGAAQEARPDIRGAAELGQAASWARQAWPCFPRDPQAAAELERLFEAATARIRGQPELEAAYENSLRWTSLQQRYIPRSDPAICGQIRDTLRRLLAG